MQVSENNIQKLYEAISISKKKNNNKKRMQFFNVACGFIDTKGINTLDCVYTNIPIIAAKRLLL